MIDQIQIELPVWHGFCTCNISQRVSIVQDLDGSETSIRLAQDLYDLLIGRVLVDLYDIGRDLYDLDDLDRDICDIYMI